MTKEEINKVWMQLQNCKTYEGVLNILTLILKDVELKDGMVGEE